MSGTNTMCVVTVLLETGMLPMTEPVTELTLEAPAGLIRVTAECRDGKVTRRHVPERAGVRDAPRRAGRGAAARARSTVDVAYGGMFYVIADAERVRAPAHPGRGRRHRPDHRDDQGGGRRAAPGRPPGAAGVRRASRSASCPARPHDPANSRRNVVTVSTGTLDWERPATWTGAIDRSPCGTGTSAKMATLHAKGAARRRRRVPPRGHPRHGLHRPRGRGDHGRGVPGDRPDDHRPGLDHRVRELRRGPDGPVPRRLHGRRHLVRSGQRRK